MEIHDFLDKCAACVKGMGDPGEGVMVARKDQINVTLTLYTEGGPVYGISWTFPIAIWEQWL